MENYVYFQGKKLRCGYTTGTCATAATKVAILVLLKKIKKDEKFVKLKVPAGETLTIPIEKIEIYKDFTKVTILKDGGDDPDVTHGAEIVSKVSFRNDKKINIFGGIGVGKVTKEGLPVKIGKSAINPTPMKMLKNVAETLLADKIGVDIEISVPKGEELAKKTLNEKLGIIGGISILGTTGIVRPMSEESWKSSLAIELKQSLEINDREKERTAVFIFGNRGKLYLAKNYPKREKQGVVISNFVGYMFDRACEYDVEKIYFVGELGKFVKVAGGIFHTHSRVADARMEILTANTLLVGEKIENLKKIMDSNTTEEAIKYIEKTQVFDLLAQKAKIKCEEHCRKNGKKIEVETLILSAEKKILGKSENFFENF